MDFLIRQATPEVAEAVVRMHTLAHEESYGDRLSAEFFRARWPGIPERVQRRRPYLASSDPRIIAVDASNDVVGLAHSGPGRDEEPGGAGAVFAVHAPADARQRAWGRAAERGHR